MAPSWRAAAWRRGSSAAVDDDAGGGPGVGPQAGQDFQAREDRGALTRDDQTAILRQAPRDDVEPQLREQRRAVAELDDLVTVASERGGDRPPRLPRPRGKEDTRANAFLSVHGVAFELYRFTI